MIVLDTDHLGEFQKGRTAAASQLRTRLEDSGDSVATTIVCVEELMRGWLAAIHKERAPSRQIRPYGRLHQLFLFLADWTILPWSESTAGILAEFRREKIRVGTMDLKIASIALDADALLLTRNLRDFDRVPGLHVEDWLS